MDHSSVYLKCEPEIVEQQLQKHIDDQDIIQLQRSTEASKQMLYEVYANTIGILEEFEKRELSESSVNIPIHRSHIQIPDQSKKGKVDVQAILQTQILILEIQMKTCAPSIRELASEELRETTLKWAAVREEKKIDMSSTDYFAGQIFQVVSKLETTHPLEFYQSPETIPNVTMDNMEQVLIQQFRIPAIDEEFSNGTKKVIVPDTRTDDIYLGIERFQRDSKLRSILPHSQKDRWGSITDKDLEESVERQTSTYHTDKTLKTKDIKGNAHEFSHYNEKEGLLQNIENENVQENIKPTTMDSHNGHIQENNDNKPDSKESWLQNDEHVDIQENIEIKSEPNTQTFLKSESNEGLLQKHISKNSSFDVIEINSDNNESGEMQTFKQEHLHSSLNINLADTTLEGEGRTISSCEDGASDRNKLTETSYGTSLQTTGGQSIKNIQINLTIKPSMENNVNKDAGIPEKSYDKMTSQLDDSYEEGSILRSILPHSHKDHVGSFTDKHLGESNERQTSTYYTDINSKTIDVRGNAHDFSQSDEKEGLLRNMEHENFQEIIKPTTMDSHNGHIQENNDNKPDSKENWLQNDEHVDIQENIEKKSEPNTQTFLKSESNEGFLQKHISRNTSFDVIEINSDNNESGEMQKYKQEHLHSSLNINLADTTLEGDVRIISSCEDGVSDRNKLTETSYGTSLQTTGGQSIKNIQINLTIKPSMENNVNKDAGIPEKSNDKMTLQLDDSFERGSKLQSILPHSHKDHVESFTDEHLGESNERQTSTYYTDINSKTIDVRGNAHDFSQSDEKKSLLRNMEHENFQEIIKPTTMDSHNGHIKKKHHDKSDSKESWLQNDEHVDVQENIEIKSEHNTQTILKSESNEDLLQKHISRNSSFDVNEINSDNYESGEMQKYKQENLPSSLNINLADTTLEGEGRTISSCEDGALDRNKLTDTSYGTLLQTTDGQSIKSIRTNEKKENSVGINAGIPEKSNDEITSQSDDGHETKTWRMCCICCNSKKL